MVMKFQVPVWVPLYIAATLSACALPPVVTVPVSAQSLVGVEWAAIAIEGVVPVIQPQPTLRWTSAEQLAGSGGCNSFVGTAPVASGETRVGSLAATGRACVTAPSGQEDMFFKALEQTRQVRLEDAQLVLLDQAGKILARLEKTKRQP